VRCVCTSSCPNAQGRGIGWKCLKKKKKGRKGIATLEKCFVLKVLRGEEGDFPPEEVKPSRMYHSPAPGGGKNPKGENENSS